MIIEYLFQRDVQFMRHDFGEGGTQALADFAVGGQDLHRAILIFVQPRHGLDNVALTGAGKARAVEVHGKADALAVAACLGLGVFLVLGTQTAGIVHLVNHGGQRHREVILAGGCVALLDHVGLLKLQRVHTQILGDVIHHHLHGKERLGCAKTAVRATGRGVGLESTSVDVQIFDVIHTVGADDAALQHDGGQGGIRAAVELHVDVHSRDLAVLDGHLVGTQGRVTLRGKFQILAAVEDAADRLSALLGGHSYLTAQNGRKCLLAAEAAAGDVLMHMDIGRAAVQRPHHRAVDIVGALHGAVDEHPPVLFRLGHHALGFQIRLILIAGLKLLGVYLVRFGKGLVDVTLLVFVIEEYLVGLPQIQHRLKLFVLYLDTAEDVLAHRLVRAADHANGLTDVLHRFAGVDRGIVHDDVHVVVAGHVVFVHIEIAVRQLRHFHGQQLRPCVFGAEHFAAENTVLVDVADVHGTSFHLGRMVFLHDRSGNVMQRRFLLYCVILGTAVRSGNIAQKYLSPSSSLHHPRGR